MKTLKLSLMLSVVAFLGACSMTPSYQTYEVVGTVVRSERAPEVCEERNSGAGSNPLLMGLLGGVIGNQFGSGNGRKAMTAVGAVTGAAMANKRDNELEGKYDCSRDGYNHTVRYIHPVSQNLSYKTMNTSKRYREGTNVRMDVDVPIVNKN